ncbi:MAG: NADH-quinone oxidoreductase subunit NuoK [Candidatus Brocadiia bacterium]
MVLSVLLIVSTLIFGLGILAVVTRRNAIGMLLGIELMLNSVNLNLVIFGRFSERIADPLEGQVYALFIMALAVAEAAVGLALILALVRKFGSVDADAAGTLKG